MAELTKVLRDDHQRIKRMLDEFNAATPVNKSLALAIVDELKIHSTIEEELFYPLLRDRVDPGQADASEEEHHLMDQLAATIEETDDDDPDLISTVEQLRTVVLQHMKVEEALFPRMSADLTDDLTNLGPAAFRMRQELLQDVPERSAKPVGDLLANTGWGGPRRPGLSNAGW